MVVRQRHHNLSTASDIAHPSHRHSDLSLYTRTTTDTAHTADDDTDTAKRTDELGRKMTTNVRPALPTEAEVSLAKESSRLLSLYLSSKEETQSIRVIDQEGEHAAVRVPTAAFRLLIDILSEMAQGNAVSLIPVHAELTTQEAADMLNVSRPHLVKLLDSGAIPFHKVGTHRRVRYQDLVVYRNRIDVERLKTLEELAAQAQELNMGY